MREYHMTIRFEHKSSLSAMATLGMLLVVVSFLSACGRSDVSEQVTLELKDPRDARVARSYGWRARAIEPQPQWHPTENYIAVRSKTGIGVLQEGSGGEDYIIFRGGQNAWDPQWVNSSQLVFGPAWRPANNATNFTMPSGKLMIATLGLNGFKEIDDFLDRGYDPEVASENAVYAQFGEDILHITQSERGDVEESFFIRGFAPRSHQNGVGMSYQTTPYPMKDFWTGESGSGSLVVRWEPGMVDLVKGAYDATWTPDGQVLATIKNENSGGEDVLLIPGPGQEVKLLATNASNAAPHPRFALAAVSDGDDGIRLLSYDRRVDIRLARRGHSPQWNHDGTRLLIQVPIEEDTPQLRVLVIVWRDAAVEALPE